MAEGQSLLGKEYTTILGGGGGEYNSLKNRAGRTASFSALGTFGITPTFNFERFS